MWIPTLREKRCIRKRFIDNISMLTIENLEHISPVIAWKKWSLPLSSLSPLERQRRRTIWRNERSLHRRICDMTKKPLLSVYTSKVPFPVYHKDLWRSDERDPLKYGCEYDSWRWFFEQRYDLFQQVPKPNLSADVVENCEWVNMFGHSKDCYLCFGGDYNEQCLYCTSLDSCSFCMDCTMLTWCQRCYECFNIQDCYQCLYSQYLRWCRDCYSCTDCKGCTNCIGCVWLHNASYHVFNQEVSPEQFEEIQKNRAEYDTTKYKELVASHTIELNQQCENVTGAYLDNCFDCTSCYNLKGSRNCSYIERGYDSEDTSDAYGSFACTKSYEILSVGVKGYGCYMSMYCRWDVSNLLYCDHCFSCQDCFGCIGLRNKQYCIFNKQYTKQEYGELVTEMIWHMNTPLTPSGSSPQGEQLERGSFFPSHLSPFAYNETKAHELFPLTQEEVQDRSLSRYEHEVSIEVTDAVRCSISGKYFRYQPKELEIYEKLGVSPPLIHPQVRYDRRQEYDVSRVFE